MQQRVFSGDGAEHDLWKGRRNSCFACQPDASAQGDKMHQGSSTHVKLFHSTGSITLRQPFGQPLAADGVVVRLSDEKAFVAKILPLDLFRLAQGMVIRKRRENPFIPERSD